MNSDHDYATASETSNVEPEPETQPESSSPEASDPLPTDESDPQGRGTSAQPKVEEMDSKSEREDLLELLVSV